MQNDTMYINTEYTNLSHQLSMNFKSLPPNFSHKNKFYLLKLKEAALIESDNDLFNMDQERTNFKQTLKEVDFEILLFLIYISFSIFLIYLGFIQLILTKDQARIG